ncbi:MAG: hypothetical protein IJ275_03380 [Ruminococcus sp.]|nr:hypothetical protein [Ruminococcus sp.]
MVLVTVALVIALIVMMIKDYKKFYVYLIAIFGLCCYFVCTYSYMLFQYEFPKIFIWLSALSVPAVLFLAITLRRKNDE